MPKQATFNKISILPEIGAEMTPVVKAFVLASFSQLEARIKELEAKIQKLTPRNSSLPPSTEHPHARPKPKPKNGKRKRK